MVVSSFKKALLKLLSIDAISCLTGGKSQQEKGSPCVPLNGCTESHHQATAITCLHDKLSDLQIYFGANYSFLRNSQKKLQPNSRRERERERSEIKSLRGLQTQKQILMLIILYWKLTVRGSWLIFLKVSISIQRGIGGSFCRTIKEWNFKAGSYS